MYADGREVIMTDNEILSEINKKWNLDETEGNERWIFKKILNHRKGPDDKLEVLILWDDESETWKPMKVFAEDDPITLARYAKKNDLLNTLGWKRFKRLAKQEKKYMRALRQSQLHAIRQANRYKFCIFIPRTWKEAVQIEKGE